MGNLADYNINEVAGSAALIISSVGGLLLICFKSRCTNVRLLWGCYDCQRNVPLNSLSFSYDCLKTSFFFP